MNVIWIQLIYCIFLDFTMISIWFPVALKCLLPALYVSFVAIQRRQSETNQNEKTFLNKFPFPSQSDGLEIMDNQIEFSK